MAKLISHTEARLALDILSIKAAVGDYILLFGSVETVIGWFIIHVSRSRYLIEHAEQYEKFMDVVLSKYNNFNTNVDIAEYLINKFQEEGSESEWKKIISELRYSMQRRNFYAHNMHTIKNNRDLVKLKVSKSSKIENHYIDITVEEIEADHLRLVKVYSSILEYIVSETDSEGNALPDLSGGIKLPSNRTFK